MKMAEHLKLLDGHDYHGRVIERPNIHGATIYYAWTAEHEGPARPEYVAAMADLREMLRKPIDLGNLF